jgi:hypothetical protein
MILCERGQQTRSRTEPSQRVDFNRDNTDDAMPLFTIWSYPHKRWSSTRQCSNHAGFGPISAARLVSTRPGSAAKLSPDIGLGLKPDGSQDSSHD